jgi:hypothetical protein
VLAHGSTSAWQESRCSASVVLGLSVYATLPPVGAAAPWLERTGEELRAGSRQDAAYEALSPLGPGQYDRDRPAGIDGTRDETQGGIAAASLIGCANSGITGVCGLLNAQLVVSPNAMVRHHDVVAEGPANAEAAAQAEGPRAGGVGAHRRVL